jgi:sarcosine oxidase subunit beta
VTLPGVSSGALRTRYDAVVVGAGIQGLATAYELAKRGMRDVLVVDRSWPGGGASGRNGELVRSIFATREWSTLFDVSLKRWSELSAELDFNILFSPSGYLVLASTDQQWANCRRDHEAHGRLGIKSSLLGESDVRDLVPHLNPELIRGGILQAGGGFAHHDAVNWGYLQAAARLGVDIHAGVTVTGIDVTRGRTTGVRTSAGDVATPLVVNAAGGGALKLNSLVGIELPMVEARLEMLVTEPLAPFLRQGLAALEIMGYCHQTARGEFVGGTEISGVDTTTSQNSTWELLRDMATKWSHLFPRLAAARILRHWAGTVTQSADLAPVIGSVPEVDGYVMSCGWVYGFMGAPGTAQLLADEIVTGRRSPVLEPFSPQRLTEGRLIAETSLVVPLHEEMS